MQRLPAPAAAPRASGAQLTQYHPVGQLQAGGRGGVRAGTETERGDGHHAQQEQQQQQQPATGLRIFSCRVAVARELLSERTPFTVMFRIYGSLVQIISPPPALAPVSGPGRSRNKKYLIISDLAANNLRIRCFFQVRT